MQAALASWTKSEAVCGWAHSLSCSSWHSGSRSSPRLVSLEAAEGAWTDRTPAREPGRWCHCHCWYRSCWSPATVLICPRQSWRWTLWIRGGRDCDCRRAVVVAGWASVAGCCCWWCCCAAAGGVAAQVIDADSGCQRLWAGCRFASR